MNGDNGGAYLLHIRVPRVIRIRAGRLGWQRLPAGHYCYVGSARRGLTQRVARHARLAREKRGNRHWHVDALLLHGWTRLVDVECRSGADECTLSRQLAIETGVSVPIPGFGATDCRAGCQSHLYRLDDGSARYLALKQPLLNPAPPLAADSPARSKCVTICRPQTKM